MLIFVVQIIVMIIVGILFQMASAAQENTLESTNKIDQKSATYFSNTTNLSNNVGHSELPQLASYGDNVYVVWIDDTSGKRSIYFKRSTDGGCTFESTINLGNQKGGSIDPKIAVSGNNVYVVWEHTPRNNGAIYFARSTDNGATFSPSENLANNSGFNGFPQIAVSGSNVFVVWHDATHGILFARSTDNGATFSPSENLGSNSGSNGFPQIAVSGSNVFIVWHDAARGIFFARSTDNGATFGSPVILYGVKNEGIGSKVFSPRITAGPTSDNVYVTWYSGDIVQHARVKALISDIQYIRSTDIGATFGDIVNLSNYSGWSINPQIAVSQNNSVYVVWTNNFQEKYGQVFLTRSTDIGATFGDIVNLSNYSGWSINPQIAVTQNNNVYVVWTNNATGNEEIFFKGGIDNNNNKCTSNATNRSENLENAKMVYDMKSLKPKNIAIVEATFTDAAYDKSFYMFYEIYYPYIRNTDRPSNITKYTDLLYSKLIENPKNWSGTEQIVRHLKWLTPKSTIDVLGDEDVHNGSSLFSANGTNLYDVIMLQHQEYVSQQEYDNLKKFVANGGILMLLDGNVFLAEVAYDENTNTIRLVEGHDFAFNGKTASKGVSERWKNETSDWVGSNYACCFSYEFIFHNDPFGITHVEEQAVTNPKAKILLDYNATINKPDPGRYVIATYELEYKKGKVITLGLYTVNKLFENERFLRFFDSLLFQYALGD
jgi:hypothetical protein